MVGPDWRLEPLFWGLIAGLLLYELVALLGRPEGDTISEIVWRLSGRPMFPFLMGFLMGHFFWPRP